MALTKQKKQEIVEEVSKLLAESKMTVVAQYDGTTVQQMQELRRQARENDTVVKVIKNRLVMQALSGASTYKDADKSQLTKQLLYAFNSADEVAPAQALAQFAKKNPSIRFVGAFTSEGAFIGADEVKALAALPGKNQLLAGLINTLNAPLRDTMSGLSGLSGILQGLEAKAAK